MSAVEVTEEVLTSLKEGLLAEKTHWSRLDKRYLKEAMLHRYLRATQGDVKKAQRMILATLAWREENGIDTMSAKEIEHHFKQGKNYLRGTDKQGRPLIYTRVKYDTADDIEGKIKSMFYQVERSIRKMGKGVEQACWMVDLTGFHAFFLSPAHCKMTAKVIGVLSAHYPERLGGLFIFNAPWIFNAFWNMCVPFVDKKTVAKIKFVKKRETALEYFYEETLEEGYFGEKPYSYDHETDFGAMMEEEAVWLKKNEKHLARHKEKLQREELGGEPIEVK